MATYSDAVEMVRDIRRHVDANPGHQVVASDNPMGQTMGYTCEGCGSGLVPRTVTWHVGLLALKSLGEYLFEAQLLSGVLTNPADRVKITEYLNGRGFAEPTPPAVRVSRYKRPPVI